MSRGLSWTFRSEVGSREPRIFRGVKSYCTIASEIIEDFDGRCRVKLLLSESMSRGLSMNFRWKCSTVEIGESEVTGISFARTLDVAALKIIAHFRTRAKWYNVAFELTYPFTYYTEVGRLFMCSRGTKLDTDRASVRHRAYGGIKFMTRAW